MTWIKLNDNAPRHPKIAGLSDRAFRAWVNGLCYASEFLTDGSLPAAFLVTVPSRMQSELIGAGLWVTDGRVVSIHDYLKHQSSRETVVKKKADTLDRVTRYREKRNAVTNTVSNAGSDALVTPPDTENREQSTDTENRTTTPSSSRGPALILSPKDYARLQETHAFVGSRLRIPNVLHLELLLKSGENADRDLQAWYLTLNDELELSGKGTGDVFAWLRPRHQAFAMSKGWIDAAPKPSNKLRPIAEIMADRERKSS